MKLDVEASTEEAAELMRSILRPQGELTSEYPLVFGDGAPGQLLAIREGDQVVSSCAILKRDLVYPEGATSVGFIGSVVTRPEVRGQGYATKLLQFAEETLRADGCQHALLWADDPVFYARRGYALDGREVDFLVDRTLGAFPVTDMKVRAMRAEESGVVHDLYSKHASRVGRSAAETATLLSCPRMIVLVAELEGEVRSYLCFGRGADLEGVAHEWGGAPEGVMACLDELLAENESIFVMAPGDPGAMGEYLDSLGALRAYGRLGMSKPLVGSEGLPEGAFIWGLDSI
jgi:GNAT superfamily N-acetyltransferase